MQNVVKEKREAEGWSQDELARRAKLSRSVIAKIETKKDKMPTMRTVVKIADAFNIGYEQIFLK